MGGFSGVLSKIGQSLTGGVERGILKSEGSAAGSEVNEFLGNQRWELDATPEGKLIKGYIDKGHEYESKFLKQLGASHNALWQGIKSDPALVSKFDYNATSLRDINNDLTQTQHPLAQHSQKLIQQNAVTVGKKTTYPNASKTLEELSFQNKRQAALLGQQQSMGRNMENIAPLIGKLLEAPTTSERMLAQRYADIVSHEFRDKETMTGFAQKGPVKGGESRTKVQLNKAFSFVNKTRDEDEGHLPMLDTKLPYTDQKVIERKASIILRTVQAALAVFPHATMEVNLAARAPAKVLLKAMLGTSKKDSDRLILSSSILAQTDADVLHNDIAARTGKIAQWTNSPTLASILDKTFHIPGFYSLRKMQIRHAGAVGFHNALYWAPKLLQGSKMAKEEFESMHIDPADVIKQGGQLTEDQLSTAVYHFANDTMFLKGGLEMPLGANKNIWMRSMYMYHFYIRNEAFFLQRTLARAMRAGDMGSVARFIGATLVAWPAAAPLFNGLELLGRTGSPSQALSETEDRYRKYVAPSSAGEWIENYAAAVAQIGAMGSYWQYAQAMKNHSFVGRILGPKLSTPATYIMDAGNAAGGGSAKPIERDLLQLIPLVGKPLSHQLVPTHKEEPSFSYHHSRSHRSRKDQ